MTSFFWKKLKNKMLQKLAENKKNAKKSNQIGKIKKCAKCTKIIKKYVHFYIQYVIIIVRVNDIYRKIEKDLKKWKTHFKMPLMLVGVKQCGKTYIIDDFCQKNYNQYIYINLDREEHIKKIFEETIDPDKIIEKIEILKNKLQRKTTN